MKTIHVLKFDPHKASRVQMQLKWETSESIVLGKCDARFSNKCDLVDNVSYYQLTIINYLKILKYHSGSYIFHMQASLPYLFIALLWRVFSGAKIYITYDMHDLNEETPGFTYAYLRYLVFYFLEYLIMRSNINIITVSDGIANEVKNRYKKAKTIKIVYSIPDRIPVLAARRNLQTRELLYFGQIASYRVTENLLKRIEATNCTLHIYGTIFSGEKNINTIFEKFRHSGTVKIMGSYKHEDLSFLSKYLYSIIDYSTSNEKNVRFCLPNKLFQSLRYGLICLISPNLYSMIQLFKDYPWNVVVVSENENMAAICDRLRYYYNEKNVIKINDYLDDLQLLSKNNYLTSVIPGAVNRPGAK